MLCRRTGVVAEWIGEVALLWAPLNADFITLFCSSRAVQGAVASDCQCVISTATIVASPIDVRISVAAD